MEFDTPDQLSHHQKKFCRPDANEDDIEKRLEELKKMEHDLNYDVDGEVNWAAGPASKAAPTMPAQEAAGPQTNAAPATQPQQQP